MTFRHFFFKNISKLQKFLFIVIIIDTIKLQYFFKLIVMKDFNIKKYNKMLQFVEKTIKNNIFTNSAEFSQKMNFLQNPILNAD